MANTNGTKKAFNARTARNKAAWFDERANRSPGIKWQRLNDLEMRSALCAALSAGATVSFSSAAGGAGIMYKVYHGEEQAQEFVGTVEELNELLTMTVNNFASSSEDVRSICSKKGEVRTLAAD